MKAGRKNSGSEKKSTRRGSKSKKASGNGLAGEAHSQHPSAGAENSDRNCQSIFSFTQHELENVLQMFEAPVGGGSADVERGYGYLQDHQVRQTRKRERERESNRA